MRGYLPGNDIKQGDQARVETLPLDVPPPLCARVDLSGLGRRFAIFADAEEEFDWSAPLNRDATGTSAISALPNANQWFVEQGCVPTYLVDWPVVANRTSADLMAEMLASNACDIGAQLHPWVTPPFDEAVSARNSFAGNLPLDLQRAKLSALSDKIATTIGTRPLVHRAGRYGVGADTATLLAELGYRLDVSVRSRFDYRAEAGPDFTKHPIWPWRVGAGIYELPLTTTFTGPMRRRARLHQCKTMRGLLARTRLFDRVPLTPEGVPLKNAVAAIAQLLNDGHKLFSLSFHTPSLVPGHTPYVRDAADLRTFWAWWDGVFDTFAKAGVAPIRSGEIIAAFDAA